MKWKKTFAVAISYIYIGLFFLVCTYPCSCQEVKVEMADASDETVKGKISGQVTELQKCMLCIISCTISCMTLYYTCFSIYHAVPFKS